MSGAHTHGARITRVHEHASARVHDDTFAAALADVKAVENALTSTMAENTHAVWDSA